MIQIDKKYRYKSANGKKINISVFSEQVKDSEIIHFSTIDTDKDSEIFTIAFKVSFLTRVKCKDEQEKKVNDVLLERGLKMIRNKIDNGNLGDENKEMTYDIINEMVNNTSAIYSPEEIFKMRYKIKQDILACLYSKTDDGATSKDLVDYVWCDTDLLLHELFHLEKAGLIYYGRFSKELIEKGGDSTKEGFNVVLILTKGKDEYEEMMEKDILGLNLHLGIFKNCIPFASNKIVFLAHRFKEKELRDKIEEELKKVDFNIKEGKLEDLGYISEDILNKIKESGFFLALLTSSREFKDGQFSTSPWVLMEIGAAIAFGRKVLILAEDIINQDEYAGKLQRDCEYINFNRDNFNDKLKVAITRITNEWDKQTID